MASIPFRRSAVYINKLRDIANQKASLRLLVRDEKYVADFETRRAADIDCVYNYIENAANAGAVRVFDWEWSTPKKERDLIFRDDEIKSYLQSNGFSYDYNCVEWWQAKDRSNELK
jgi:hypothetical protein